MSGRDAGEAHNIKGRRRTSRLLSKTEKWQPRNWRLRSKMTAVVLVPALTALAFAGLRIQAELSDASDYNRIVSQVDASMLITEVVHQLQGERSAVAAAVADGTIVSNEKVQNQYRATDASISELRDKIGGLELSDSDSKDRYNYAFNQLSQLTPLRNLAGSSTYPDLAVLSAYNAVIDPLVQLGREITTAGNATGQSPSRLSAAVQSIGQAKERASQLDALLMVSAVRNSFRSANVQNQAAAASAGFDASVADFFALATPDEQQGYNDGYSGAEVDRRKGFAQSALLGADPTAPLDIDLKTLHDTSTAANNKLRGVETNLVASLRTQASTLATEATTTAWQVGLIVVGAMLVALLLMLAMAQSLVNPLRRLRRGALKVANITLPATIDRILADANPVEAAKNAVAPMPVDTSEEIGQVARSFDVVHERAVRLATEQAVLRDNVNDMFVNLSRRSQALVERQLSELDKLEQSEQDPDQLAHFFVLDHLAARMRRNSENLLILSGVGVARRSSQPVSINEVIGAAQSEIESYARVVMKPGPDTVVQGRVVNDIVHLLAELLDNATKFSAADTEVTVTSAHIRSGELAVQISDKGLGLSDEELTDINRRLIDPPPFDLAVSRRMGLYVVARLAKRHDIRVRLHGEFNSGTSAVVILPRALTGEGPVVGPTSPVPAIMTGPTELVLSQPGIHTGQTAIVQTGPHTGPHTGPQTVARTGQQQVGPHTGQQPMTRTGPQQGAPVGPPTGQQPGVPMGPPTGQQQGAPVGPPTGQQTAVTRHNPTGPLTNPTGPMAGPPTGSQPVAEPAHAAPEGVGRSAWFQRTAPVDVDKVRNGNGNGGNGNGNGKGGKGKGKKEPKAASPSSLNWSTAGEDGWSAVRRKLGETAQQSKVDDGLPRRTPGQHLVPGSAGARQMTTGNEAGNGAGNGEATGSGFAPAEPPSKRTAEHVRSRLSGFQQGLSRARNQHGPDGRPGGEEQ